jgi:hypothetical protein
MSPLRDEYEREASYAMEMADRAPDESLRAEWVRLARKWLAMLPHRHGMSAKVFETAVGHNGTGQ